MARYILASEIIDNASRSVGRSIVRPLVFGGVAMVAIAAVVVYAVFNMASTAYVEGEKVKAQKSVATPVPLVINAGATVPLSDCGDDTPENTVRLGIGQGVTVRAGVYRGLCSVHLHAGDILRPEGDVKIAGNDLSTIVPKEAGERYVVPILFDTIAHSPDVLTVVRRADALPDTVNGLCKTYAMNRYACKIVDQNQLRQVPTGP